MGSALIVNVEPFFRFNSDFFQSLKNIHIQNYLSNEKKLTMLKQYSFLVFWLLAFNAIAVFASQAQETTIFPFQKGEKTGYINAQGKVVIEPQFDDGERSFEGIARVTKFKVGYGYITNTGKWIARPQYEVALNFSEGLAAVCKDNKCGYLNKRGQVVIPLQFAFDHLTASEKYKTDLDKDKAILFPPVASFSEGLAVVVHPDKDLMFIDKSGKAVIGDKILKSLGVQQAASFSEGLAAVTINERIGFIDKTGRLVITPKFSDVGKFMNGVTAAKIDDTWGFIDKTGNFITEPQFDWVASIQAKTAVVLQDNKFGYFSIASNSFLIPPQFESANDFCGDVAAVAFREKEWGGYWMLVDKQGKFASPTKFGSLGKCGEGLFQFGGDGEGNVGYMNGQGKVIFSIKN